MRATRGRAPGGALLALGLLLLAPAIPAGATAPARCPPDRLDLEARMARVHDGDTLRLEDGRVVRLAGINAPEVARDGRPAEPYGPEARERLRRLLPPGARVGLRLGQEQEDRYGRLLAHLYIDGRSVQALLLREGLAVAIVVPPNSWQRDCYFRAEAEARLARRGVWADWLPVPAARLDPSIRGFRVVRGRLTGLRRTRRSLWLELEEGRVRARIARQDLPRFRDLDLQGALGRTGELRGWLRPHRGAPTMRLRHPAMLRLPGGDGG